MSFRSDSIPRHREGADGQRFGSDFVVMDPEGRMLRGLNDTAARIWEMSDGQRTAREISRVVADEYGVTWNGCSGIACASSSGSRDMGCWTQWRGFDESARVGSGGPGAGRL